MRIRLGYFTDSLSRRLLVILALAMLVTLTATVYSVFHTVDHEAEEVLDARQIRVLEDLLRQLTGLIREDHHNEAWLVLETTRGLENAWLSEFVSSPALLFFDQKIVLEGNNSEVKVYVWLVNGSGNLLLGTPMPDFLETGNEKNRMRSLHREGREWRVAHMDDESGEYRIFMATRDDLRNYLKREVGRQVILLQLIAIPLVILALWVGIHRGLRPLSRLSRQISDRHPSNLRPVDLQNVPREVLPVMHSINNLLERLNITLEAERSFTANAAHELRSPLAVARNLSRVMGEADSLQEVRRSSDLLDQGVSRMAELLSQLLHLARLDSAVQNNEVSLVSLRNVVEAVVSAAMPVAVEKSVEITYDAELEVAVRGDGQLLEMMLANLLANALKYGHDGGTIMLRVRCEQDNLDIEILDDGPGVEPHRLAHLFERFYRTAKAKQQAQGTGLGLAIVKRIAELHDAEVWAENREISGLKITIRLPNTRWSKVTEGLAMD